MSPSERSTILRGLAKSLSFANVAWPNNVINNAFLRFLWASSPSFMENRTRTFGENLR